MADISSEIFSILEDMLEEDLKRFRYHLSEKNLLEGFSRIPKGQLENKSRTDIGQIMMANYGKHRACELTLHILRKMKQNELADSLERACRQSNGLAVTGDQEKNMENAQQKLKSSLMTKFKEVSEGVAKQGKKTLLNNVYTDVYMIEGESEGINSEHEVRQIEIASKKPSAPEIAVLSSNIFKPLRAQSKQIRTVVTKGIAGIGKTIFVQKFILDWAEGKLNQDIYFTFILPFRELNAIKNDSYSLLELIYYCHPELEVYGNVLLGDKKVLFIFDGLDESRIPLNFSGKKWYDTTEKTSVDMLLTNLIKGNLLHSSALLWITTRPAAASQIPPDLVNRVTEVKGFKDQQKEEYFRKRFSESESMSRRVIAYIKSTRSLYIMCHIPVFCWISATVLEQLLDDADAKDASGPKTLTQMYTRFLLTLTDINTQKYVGEEGSQSRPEAKKEKETEIIMSLGKLAFQHLDKGELIFYEDELMKCGIDITKASMYSMFTEIFKDSDISRGKVFSFIHLSIQEYFAALYVFLSYRNEKLNLFEKSQKLGHKISKLFKKSSLFDLHKCAVDKALQCQNGELDLFLRFLMGISREPPRAHLLTEESSSVSSLGETIKYIKSRIKKNPSPERSINMFHCLIELDDNSLVEEIQSYLKVGTLEGKEVKLSPAHWSALAYALLMSEDVLDEFDLKKYIRSDEGLQRLLPVIKYSRAALMDNCNLTKTCCESLSVALGSDLKQLTLSHNDLQDAGAKQLCIGLEDQNCKLEKLRLDGCRLTDKCCERLAQALAKSLHLKELDLSDNNLLDSGVGKLAAGLANANCNLEELSLRWCKLTGKCCKELASAMSSSSSKLKKLDLSDNELQDSGVKDLSAGLEKKDCKLETLSLHRCGLTLESCEKLAYIVSLKSSKLRELDLRDNDVLDSGAKQLSVGLGNPQCKLRKLRLSGCQVTDAGCASLASALQSNPSHLRELDLSYNHPGDSGAKLLSAILKDSKYKLKNVNLEHGGVSRNKPGLRKYACQLTLDPNTAHKCLSLSEGNTKLTLSDEQSYPDHEERFDRLDQVLCREALADSRFYWEVEWAGCWTSVGVAQREMTRKGKGDGSRLGHNERSWSLLCSDGSYSAQHGKRVIEIPVPCSKRQRVGVFLDCPGGTLSFYDVSDDAVILLHTFHAAFADQPILPGFGIGFELQAGQGHRLDRWEEPSIVSLCKMTD